MKVLFTEEAWEDYLHWQHHDRKTLKRINALIHDIGRDPFDGKGKPEPLKATLSGWWSRRITHDHRLIYRVVGEPPDQRIEIVQCRYHY